MISITRTCFRTAVPSWGNLWTQKSQVQHASSCYYSYSGAETCRSDTV